MGVIAKKKLLKHPAFDETDFMDWEIFLEDEHDKSNIRKKVLSQADWHAQKRLSFLYAFIYPKLIVEIFVPIVIGVLGLFKLYVLITS
tara:strand:- start:1077 stop:1340 length:264 start_codon:yes stop_codon:yes gene_type:complete